MSGLDIHDLAAGAGLVAALVIFAGLLQNLLQVVQLGFATHALSSRGRVRAPHLWRRFSNAAPPITLLAPAFNEELTIVESVRSLLNLQYPAFEIIVVNDGSTDGTLQALVDAFELTPAIRAHDTPLASEPVCGVFAATHQPRLLVVDKANGGKADALNAALNFARNPVVCAIDSDSLLEPDALLRAVQPFIDDPERVVAVGGTVRIANGCLIDHGRVMEVRLPRNPLAILQTVEYLRAFLMARLAWSQMEALTIISGAFGLFLRQAVLDAGGYRRDTVGEDMELIVRLHRDQRDRGRDYRIAFVPEPVCWTEAPSTLAVLARQRQRWQRGALETFARHADMLFKPRYGRVAGLGMTNILVTDVLGPVLEILGYLLIPVLCLMGVLSTSYLLAFLAVSIGFGVVISVASLAMEEAQLRRVASVRDLLVLLAASILENVGYRQLNNIWRLQGTWQFLTGSTSWGAMTRRGFDVSAPAALRG